ncbi:MAG: OsmC family protein [Chloroflexota bacterium]
MAINGWAEVNTSWKGEMGFVGVNSAGAKVHMGTVDGESGIGPMQMLLMGLAGCAGMDIVSIMQKKRADLTDFQVSVRALRADEFPMIYTDLQVVYTLWGNDLQPKDIEQAIQLSEEKYCSVGIMLGKSSRITSGYRILNPGEKAE